MYNRKIKSNPLEAGLQVGDENTAISSGARFYVQLWEDGKTTATSFDTLSLWKKYSFHFMSIWHTDLQRCGSSSQSFIYHPARWSWILYQPSFAGSNIKNQPNKTQNPKQVQLVKQELVKVLAVVKDVLKMQKPIVWRITSNKERLYLNINTRQSSKLREINLNNIILLSSMHNPSPLLLHNWSPKSNSCAIPNTMNKNWQKQFIPEPPSCFPKTPLCQ